MAYVLIGTDDTATYTTTNTLYVPEAWQVNITAVEFPIAYQLQMLDPSSPSATGGQLWMQEEVLQVVPGGSGVTIAGMARRCAGIQIRSLTVNDLAWFQAVLVPPSEVSPEIQSSQTVPGWAGQRSGGMYPDPLPHLR